MSRTPHSGAPKGKRVRLILKDGSVVDGKFVERTDKFVVLEHRRIEKHLIRAFFITRK